MKQKLKGGFEWDWVSVRWRRLMNWNSGVGKSIKRKMNKRIRKEGKNDCKDT